MSIILTGKDLSIEDLVKIARDNEKVELQTNDWSERLVLYFYNTKKLHKFYCLFLQQPKPLYIYYLHSHI